MNWLIKIIQDRRLQKDYNFNDIEALTGIPVKRMYQFEQGKLHLTLNEIEQLFQILDLNQDQLQAVSSQSEKQVEKNGSRKSKKLLLSFSITLMLLLAVVSIIFFQDWGENASPSAMQPNEFETTHTESLDDQSFVSVLEQISAPQNLYKDHVNADDKDGVNTHHATVNTESTNISSTTKAEPDINRLTTLRFWGNLLYQSETLPNLPNIVENDREFIEVFHIEELEGKQELPPWLQDREKDNLLLNFGTIDIFASRTLQERDRLNKLGYKNIGLDFNDEVYKPIIIEHNDTHIGFLSFTRIIHDVKDEATTNRIGLPKAYDENIILNSIKSAREHVDLLVVLMDWGKKRDDMPTENHRKLAQKMAEAGADLIVGNHPIQAQNMEWIDDKPVFYSLGHIISPQTNMKASNFVLEVDLNKLEVDLNKTKVDKVRIYPGRFENGKVNFQLNEQEKEKVREHILTLLPNDPRIKIID